MIDQALAGSLGSGSVSALAYGSKLASVSATAIATAVLPEFSRLAAQNDWSHLRHTVRVHSAVIALLALPAVAATAVGDLILARTMGIAGIPLADTLAHAIALGSLVYFLYRREPRLFGALG